MYHDEYDVTCRIVGTPEQIDAVIMAAQLQGFWSVLEHCMFMAYTPDHKQATIGYTALNEKIWDIEGQMLAAQRLSNIAAKMGLQATYSQRRCH